MILIYLQQNLTSIPQHMLGKDVVHSEKKAMEKRRKMVIKTMQDMSILDMVRKDEDEFTRWVYISLCTSLCGMQVFQ